MAYRYYLAAILPISNDEAYYFEWSYHLQLSYFDHPPGVSWIGYLARQLFSGHLAARGISPIIYFVASLLLWECYIKIAKPAQKDILHQSILFALIISFIPTLSLWGVGFTPDIGLFFSISLVLYLVLNYREADYLTVFDGVLLGVALGIGGLFKYHILLVGGGLCIALFIQRVWFWRKPVDWQFWLAVGILGFVVTLPVWIWNYQNNFEGILFQADHGFADGSFKPAILGQILVYLLVLVTPGLFWVVLRRLFSFNKTEIIDSVQLYYLLGVGLLFVVLFYSSLFKQPLPHWFYPGVWLALPFVFVSFIHLPRVLIGISILFALVMCIVLPVSFGLQSVQNYLVNTFPKQSSIRGFTFWDDVYSSLDYQAMESFLQTNLTENIDCKGPEYGSFRWFWVAQLNYRSREDRKWKSVDQKDKSFYHYIYPHKPDTGCKIVLVGDNKHINFDKLQSEIEIVDKKALELKKYDGMEVSVILGKYR